MKTADGKRQAIRPADVEDRKVSEVSLMPEGLAEAMTDLDLVDLLAFLATLKEPVSIVGQYQAIGPIADGRRPDHPEDASGNPRKPTWRRLDANAEGFVDLAIAAGDDPSKAAYLVAPVLAPEDLDARLVLDTPADLKAWLDGKELAIPAATGDQPRTVPVRLTRGEHELVLRVAGGPKAGIVTTFVAAQAAGVPHRRRDRGLGALSPTPRGSTTGRAAMARPVALRWTGMVIASRARGSQLDLVHDWR